MIKNRVKSLIKHLKPSAGIVTACRFTVNSVSIDTGSPMPPDNYYALIEIHRTASGALFLMSPDDNGNLSPLGRLVEINRSRSDDEISITARCVAGGTSAALLIKLSTSSDKAKRIMSIIGNECLILNCRYSQLDRRAMGIERH